MYVSCVFRCPRSASRTPASCFSRSSCPWASPLASWSREHRACDTLMDPDPVVCLRTIDPVHWGQNQRCSPPSCIIDHGHTKTFSVIDHDHRKRICFIDHGHWTSTLDIFVTDQALKDMILHGRNCLVLWSIPGLNIEDISHLSCLHRVAPVTAYLPWITVVIVWLEVWRICLVFIIYD